MARCSSRQSSLRAFLGRRVLMVDLVFGDRRRRRGEGLRRLGPSARPLFALDQILLLLYQLLAAREISLAIEVDFALDERLLDARVDAERMRVEDRQIGILADIDA